MNDLDRMELKISKFLRYGVIVAGLIILIGWIVSFNPDKNPFIGLQTYRPFTIFDSIQMYVILESWGNLIIYFGLSLLISLPILRVVLSTVLFMKQKEKTMALIGATVLLGLILSFSLGL